MINKRMLPLISTLIVITPSLVFAQNLSCSLNGAWLDYQTGYPSPVLKQEGAIVTTDEDTSDNDRCGKSMLLGMSDGTNFNFRVSYTNPPSTDEYCQSSYLYFEGSFIDSRCNLIQGQAKIHYAHNGFPHDEIYKFLFYQDVFKITYPDPKTNLIISAEPKMPAFTAKADFVRPDVAQKLRSLAGLTDDNPIKSYKWHTEISYFYPKNSKNDGNKTPLPDVVTAEPTFTPDFEALKDVYGGTLDLAVTNQDFLFDVAKYTIIGTNPGQAAIESMLTNTMSRQIACQESRYKQFLGNREGGVGGPNIGKTGRGILGGVGLMQIYQIDDEPPTQSQVWNWRSNILGGLIKISNSEREAKILHLSERTRLNNERKKAGLPACPKGIPTPLNSKQIYRDKIRRYNAGREYRWEPRDAPNCEGRWVIHPSCLDKPEPSCEADYVNKVLACDINK